MWKKVLSCLIAIMMMATIFTACAPEETSLRLPVDSIPSSCDPVLSNSTAMSTIAANCFEGLVRIDENGNVQPGAADHWNISDDGLTYTFILRDGLKWHVPDSDSEQAAAKNPLGEDFILNFNRTMTADDFVYGLQRAVAKNTSSPGASLLFGIQNAEEVNSGELSTSKLGVSAVNDTTVRIRLSSPDNNFLTALGSAYAMPCSRKFFKETAGRYGLTASLLLCNGPYYLSSMSSSGNSVTLTKNEDYTGLTPGSIDTCTLVLGTENSADSSDGVDILSDFNSDEGTLDGAILSQSASSSVPSSFELTEYNNITNTLLFNLESDFSGNENLRMALARAVDASSLIENGSSAAQGIIPDSCNAISGTNYRENAGEVTGPVFNLNRAKKSYAKAMEEFEAVATKDDPAPTSFSIRFLCLTEDKQLAQSIVQNWQKVFGTALSTTIETRDTEAALQSAIVAGNYDVAFAPIQNSELTAIGVLKQFTGDTDKNLVNLASDEYDHLLTLAASSTDAETVTGYCLAAEKYLTKNGILLPISESSTSLAIKKKTAENLTVYPNGDTYLIYLA